MGVNGAAMSPLLSLKALSLIYLRFIILSTVHYIPPARIRTFKFKAH